MAAKHAALVPLWCQALYCRRFVAALVRRGRRALRQTGRPDGRRKSCVRARRQCLAADVQVPRFRDTPSIAHCMGRCTRARMRHAALWTGGGGGSTGCGRLDGRPYCIQTRQSGRFARPTHTSRGTTGHAESLIEATLSRRSRRSRRREASWHWLSGSQTTTAAATPSAPNKRPPATVERHARGRRKRRQRQLHLWGYTQQCGSGSSSSRDGGSPSKTNRLTPARPADAAPGAAACFRNPLEKTAGAQPASLRRTSFHAVSHLANCYKRGRGRRAAAAIRAVPLPHRQHLALAVRCRYGLCA